MKKLIVLVLTLVVVLSSSIAVLAEEVPAEATVTYNMDAETYESIRMAQIDEALANHVITVEQAEALRAHVLEVAANETFGYGPVNGNKGDGDVDCVLGDDLNLGIFRSESAGMRTGSGNGVGQRLADGTAAGNGKANGQGNRGANKGSGFGNGNLEDCILD